MAKYSKKSRERRDTCNSKLIHIADRLIDMYDNTFVWGFRNHEEQEEAYRNKKSKLRFPYSAHNRYPSRAMDLQPYPYPGGDEHKVREEFMFMRGIVYAIAYELGINLKSTITWDLFHFELEDSE